MFAGDDHGEYPEFFESWCSEVVKEMGNRLSLCLDTNGDLPRKDTYEALDWRIIVLESRGTCRFRSIAERGTHEDSSVTSGIMRGEFLPFLCQSRTFRWDTIKSGDPKFFPQNHKDRGNLRLPTTQTSDKPAMYFSSLTATHTKTKTHHFNRVPTEKSYFLSSNH